MLSEFGSNKEGSLGRNEYRVVVVVVAGGVVAFSEEA